MELEELSALSGLRSCVLDVYLPISLLLLLASMDMTWNVIQNLISGGGR